MKRCLILVEGRTEEIFVKDCLAPHLQAHRVALIPTIVTTKRVKSGPDFKGGVVRYDYVKNDLRRLCGDSDAIAITTLIDYYGLPSDFPGMDSRPPVSARSRIEHVESAFARDIDDARFIPFLVLHEFEAWIFADLQLCEWVFDHRPEYRSELARLRRIRQDFESPEDINEGRHTAPSKRILQVIDDYEKALHGPMAVEAIGLDTVRAECPHFDAWLSRLEALGA